MGKKADPDEKLRRQGRAVYDDIVIPRRRAPTPSRFESPSKPWRTFDGVEFAREALSTKQFQTSIGSRSRVTAFQHIVASKADETSEDGRRLTPWKYRVIARCKAKLRRAAVKVGRQFLELDVCPKCWKTVPADG